MDYGKLSLELHEKNRGKIEIVSKVKVTNKEELSLAYTPGVAEPCKEIFKDKENVYKYTPKGNLVAVISNGTAVLGLGNIGPEASIPVTEGKGILFKEFGGVNAIPIAINQFETEEIIKTIKAISPTFGGINLEDIKSPECFEIERRLEEELDIPIFHDDQHGTAIVVTAGLINAAKVVNKELKSLRIVVNGPGAAGTAIIKMLNFIGVNDIIACDEHGILHASRELGITDHKIDLCKTTNKNNISGTLSDALVNADVFIGVSVAGALKAEYIKTMNTDPIVFAMANPIPEIMYDEAIAAGVKVMGTGRSDFPNQINNVLAFPGVFRGALDANARNISYDMKYAAAIAISKLVSEDELKTDYVIPSPFDLRVAPAVAKAVKETAIATNQLRK